MPIYIGFSLAWIVVASVCYLNLLFALWLVDWPVWLSLSIATLVLVDYGRVLRGQSLRLIFKDCDKWQYEFASGKRYKGTLIPQRSYRSALLLILYFRHLTGGRYLIIPRGSVSFQHYRYLSFELGF